MRFKAALLGLICAVTLSHVALAHDMAKGVNGGQVVEDAGHHVEFTTKDGQVVLFLTDGADKPLTSVKATGRAIIQDSGKQATLDLVAAEPNMMTGKLGSPLSTGAKLVVSIKLGDGHDVKARFVAK